MSKRKGNGDVGVIDDPLGTQQKDIGKRKILPRMVKDPFTGELRPENKQEKFVRLAEHRVTNALKRMHQIKALGNRNQYSYSEDDANKIVAALQQGVNDIKAAFSGNRISVQGFRL